MVINYCMYHANPLHCVKYVLASSWQHMASRHANCCYDLKCNMMTTTVFGCDHAYIVLPGNWPMSK